MHSRDPLKIKLWSKTQNPASQKYELKDAPFPPKTYGGEIPTYTLKWTRMDTLFSDLIAIPVLIGITDA